MSNLPPSFFAKVANRGAPTIEFIKELIKWAKGEADGVFEPNSRYDIYSIVKPILGPWKSTIHRRAVMCEVLRVLAGFESSWKQNEDKDVANPAENSPETWSSGPFQISANSMNLDPELKAFAKRELGGSDPNGFRRAMMSDWQFAMAYTARLLRINTNHNGPVKRKEILPWLKEDAVDAFMKELA